MLTTVVAVALAQGKHVLIQQLQKVTIMTIDSSMGQDRSNIIVDTAGYPKYIFESPRTLVALTRAKAAMVLILPTLEFTAPEVVKKAKKDHPLHEIIYKLRGGGHIRTVRGRT
jgi:hypothetical protein